MGRPVSFDFTTGGGSPEEFLMGTVHLEPTLMHTIGTTVVLPDAPYPVKLVNGKAVHPDVAISPAGPEPEWAYKVTIENELTGKAWSEFRGVPSGTTQIAYKELPLFVTTIPPETTAGMMQNWADTTETNAARSEAAADRAEAPTDQMNKTLIENPDSLTYGALTGAIGEGLSPYVPRNSKRSVGQGELFVSVKDYGAIGDGVADDTAAFDAAWVASIGHIFVPAGKYKYNGTALPYVTDRPMIHGSGRGKTTIVLGSGGRLFDSGSGVQVVSFKNFRTEGGAGVFRSTRTSNQVAGLYIFTGCEFTGYTECCIEGNSSDMPYWKIKENIFDGANFTTTMGIAFSGLSDGNVVESNEFLRNRVHIKVRRGGNNAHILKNDFIRFGATQGQSRIDVWMVPSPGVINSGSGCTISENKFGPENMHSADYRILYADELAGATNGSMWPNLTSESVGYISGHVVDKNTFGGVSGAAPAPVFSLTQNVRDCVYGPVILQGSTPDDILHFKYAPVRGRLNLNNTIGPIVGGELTETTPPLRSNDPGQMPAVDPTGSLAANAGEVQQWIAGDPVGYTDLLRTDVNTFSRVAGVTAAPVADAHGGSDAAVFTFGAAFQEIYSNLTGGLAGTPVWIEFDAQAGTLDTLRVNISYTSEPTAHWQRIVRLSAGTQRFRFPWTPREVTGTLRIHMFSLGAGTVRIGRVRIYHSREPLNVDGVVLIGGVKYRLSVSGGAITATAV